MARFSVASHSSRLTIPHKGVLHCCLPMNTVLIYNSLWRTSGRTRAIIRYDDAGPSERTNGLPLDEIDDFRSGGRRD